MRHVYTLLAAVSAVVPVTRTVHGYEDDVHFGLTQWLALQAAFDADEAKTVAAGAVSFDHSALSAPNLVVHYACLSKDVPASQVVQENHFPGDGAVPGLPKDRVVAPGSAEALRKSNDQIAHPTANLKVSIERFGQGLHSLEDSWSHQGIPDSPWTWMCDEQLSWGHPKARGGWRHHKADLTYEYPSDTMKMAEATYNQMCRYTIQVLKRRCTKPFARFSGDVNRFAVAKTKAEKEAWFNEHGIKDTGFLEYVDLPPGKYQRATSRGRSAKSNARSLEDTRENRFWLAFFRGWMTVDNPAIVAKEMIDLHSFTYRPGPDALKSSDPEAVGALLALWRVRDHGEVQNVLHEGTTLDAKTLFKSLDRAKRSLGQGNDFMAPYESVEEALLPLDDKGTPIVVGKVERPDGSVLLAMARFRHAPYDSVIVTATTDGDRYRVVRIDSVVEH